MISRMPVFTATWFPGDGKRLARYPRRPACVSQAAHTHDRPAAHLSTQNPGDTYLVRMLRLLADGVRLPGRCRAVPAREFRRSRTRDHLRTLRATRTRAYTPPR